MLILAIKMSSLQVIDENGHELPALEEMLTSLKEKHNIQGYVKPLGQLVRGNIFQ